MKDVNKVILVGRLGMDPVRKETRSGSFVCRFSVATRIPGERELTEWHRIVVWGPMSETCEKYLRKGDLVYLEGAIRTYRFTNEEQEAKVLFEVHASEISFLSPKRPQEDLPESLTLAGEPEEATAERRESAKKAPVDAETLEDAQVAAAS